MCGILPKKVVVKWQTEGFNILKKVPPKRVLKVKQFDLNVESRLRKIQSSIVSTFSSCHMLSSNGMLVGYLFHVKNNPEDPAYYHVPLRPCSVEDTSNAISCGLEQDPYKPANFQLEGYYLPDLFSTTEFDHHPVEVMQATDSVKFRKSHSCASARISLSSSYEHPGANVISTANELPKPAEMKQKKKKQTEGTEDKKNKRQKEHSTDEE